MKRHLKKRNKKCTEMAVKDKDRCLTHSELLRNVFFMDRLKATVRKLVL